MRKLHKKQRLLPMETDGVHGEVSLIPIKRNSTPFFQVGSNLTKW